MWLIWVGLWDERLMGYGSFWHPDYIIHYNTFLVMLKTNKSRCSEFYLNLCENISIVVKSEHMKEALKALFVRSGCFWSGGRWETRAPCKSWSSKHRCSCTAALIREISGGNRVFIVLKWLYIQFTITHAAENKKDVK